jgi:hypothetical protein
VPPGLAHRAASGCLLHGHIYDRGLNSETKRTMRGQTKVLCSSCHKHFRLILLSTFSGMFLTYMLLMWTAGQSFHKIPSVAGQHTVMTRHCDCTTNVTSSTEHLREKTLLPQQSIASVPQEQAQQSQENLVLSYFSGKFDMTLFNIFVRSLRGTGCTARVVVMIHGFNPSQQAKALADVFDVQLVPVNPSLMQDIPWSNEHYLFRFHAWNHFLRENHGKFCHVLNADVDVLFQADPFLCFFGRECNPGNSVLHTFSENPVLRIGACPVHRSWYMNDCVLMDGPKYFTEHQDNTRICAGFTIGTVRAYQTYLGMMEKYMFQTSGKCNDQGMHNILVWGNLLTEIGSVYVWDYFKGPVKTVDVGYVQDEFGRIINDNGLPYCVVHQFKEDRNGQFVANLKHRFPLHAETARVHFEDTRFAECTHADCKGVRVHNSAQLMIEQKLIGGWRGPLPEMHRVLNPIGPLPKHGLTSSNVSSYALLSSRLHKMP